MRLNQIHHLKESGDVYSFISEKWDGNEAEGLHIEPFNVLVKYHGEHGGSSDHPHGEGTAREIHGDTIQVVSITADEPVKITAESGPRIEQLADHKDLHAVVVGKLAAGTLKRVEDLFPHAAVMKGGSVEKGMKGAKQLMNFFEDHTDEDVIINVDTSPMLNDIDCIAVLKALLDDGIVRFVQLGAEKIFEFHGRIIIVVSDLHQIDDAIEKRCVVVDLTKDKILPRGTALQDIPGWDEKSMKYFEEQAEKNFTGLGD